MGMVTATAAPGAALVPGPRREQWWFTTWDIQNKVWPITQGKGVTVALLDTGIQAALPDFSGAVLSGTDATGGGGDGRVDKDSSPVPGHGTGMATLIAAQGRGTGAVGVAPQAKILPIVVRSGDSVVTGIRYAADHGAKVINISQGAPQRCPGLIQDAVAYAIQKDVVVIASAGDDGDVTNSSEFPGNCAGVLAVGAVDYRFKPWTKTQRQPYVSVAAPGVAVGGVLKDGRWHSSPGGTSGAAALTSAAVALVRSKFPDMSAREVVQRIIASARDVGPKGKDNQTGYGLIRPSHALVDNVPKNSPNPVFEAYDKWAAANGKGNEPGAAAGQENAGEASDSTGSLLMSAAIFAGIVLLVLLLVVFFRSRRRRAAPVGPPPGYPYHGPPQQYGAPQGPPAGFGAPPGQPPQQGGGGYPGFRPPQGPPAPQGPPGPHQPPQQQRPQDWPSPGGPRE
jgi:hypothetical protein